MKYKLISCNVFKAELEFLRSESSHSLEVEFLELGEHAYPASLRQQLQQRIDASSAFDAILLAYGLCGTAAVGLTAREVPVVIIRNHDCGGILLGSRKRFEEIFKEMPSTPFASVGFANSGDYYFSNEKLLLGDAYSQLVKLYGKDNADYIREAMLPKLNGKLQPLYFIHTVNAAESLHKCRNKAKEEGRDFRELEGDLRLLRKLIQGDWTEEEFLILHPGKSIYQVGDWDRIIEARK